MKLTLSVLLILVFCVASFGQQTDRDRAISLFKQGDLDAARPVFEKLVKTNSSDAEAHNYLGLIHLRKKENKKARQNLENAVELDPKNSEYRLNLAKVFLVSGDTKKARSQADQVLQADPKNIPAYYVRGKANLAENDLKDAETDARKALELDPANPLANVLKADILLEKYIDLIRRDYSRKNDVDGLRLAVETLDNCLQKCTKNDEIAKVEERRDIVGAFLEAADRKSATFDPEKSPETSDPGNRRVKILSKPRASYTDKARMQGISGSVALLVLFAADGTIPYIILVKSLDPDLDRNAVEAASQIRFEPRMREEKRVSSAILIQYGFSTY